MDTFSQSSPGFVNLLSSQSSKTVEVGSSEVPKPAGERRKWTTQEDIILISAWLNTSKDPIVSNQQKLGSFWRRIEDYFNASAQLGGFLPREWSQCKQRWGRVNEQVCKFVGSYEAALKEQSSGQNENDVMKSAHDIFFNDHQAKFALEHAWRELRYDQKWRSNSISRDGGKAKMKEAAETVPDSDEARPPGVKACKAAKRKKPGNEAAFDRLEIILEKKQNISKQKILDRLLSKNIATLTEAEVALKDKLVKGSVGPLVTGIWEIKSGLDGFCRCHGYCSSSSSRVVHVVVVLHVSFGSQQVSVCTRH
ncbi:glutathione S-transferase T3-like [Brassica rapa]|uniref:glutathione S-transferase T3-like n=1 Tax=Brassica napus TaxID=3708 RepID=UPI0006AAD5C5|nr:glutathione S-transferase T3-like [Brassica napus]XP_033145262.1 glutathione S-transferase T3-like [Brassica rapa]XP_033147805.1 glutathione S-transferase T3-like [Brassica rapa]XP_048596562.1 glutathione S-transferase T3-like [Brassica napus]